MERFCENSNVELENLSLLSTVNLSLNCFSYNLVDP